jgi:uncharacterized DUF497 family protein
MPKWSDFAPKIFEYDHETDELHAHRITIDEAVQCFYSEFEVRRNKKYKDRFKLLGRTDSGRKLCIIFQLKNRATVRIITGWDI